VTRQACAEIVSSSNLQVSAAANTDSGFARKTSHRMSPRGIARVQREIWLSFPGRFMSTVCKFEKIATIPVNMGLQMPNSDLRHGSLSGHPRGHGSDQ
jgi:hypothetical protein